MAAGPRRLRYPLHKSGSSGPRGPERIRLDQRGRLQRLRLSRYDPRPDAGRYECGTLNTIGCFGLKASIEFLLEVGPGEIAPVVQNLGDRIAAGVQAKGYELFLHR